MTLQKNSGAVRRFARLLKFAGWLQTLPNRVTPPPFRLIQLGSAYWQSRVLYVAARLDIASLLADEELSCQAIADRTATSPDATCRLLRMLSAMGIFEEVAPLRFRNNKLSAHLRTDHPHNVRAMILMHNSEVMSRPWYEQLETGIREGRVPFELAHGQELFDYMDSHDEFDALFTQAMDTVEALTGDSYATDFDWSRFERLLDIGGSRGAKAVTILKHHPRLRAVVVDRAQVIADAVGYWHGRVDREVTGRLDFIAGDALTSVPPATGDKDIYFLSAVLHGFDDERCVTILRKLATALGRTNSRIAVFELMLPEAGTDLAEASFDMQMFMGTRGRERTQAEWQRLFEQAELQLDEVVDLRSLAKILVVKRKYATAPHP